MAVGHARRIRLPIPILRSMAGKPAEEDGGRARHVGRGSADLELLFGVKRALLAGPKIADQ